MDWFMLMLSLIAMDLFVMERSPTLMLKVLVLLSSVNPYWPGDG